MNQASRALGGRYTPRLRSAWKSFPKNALSEAYRLLFEALNCDLERTIKMMRKKAAKHGQGAANKWLDREIERIKEAAAR